MGLKPKFAGLVIHGQHVFQRYIGHDTVIRAADVAAVFIFFTPPETHLLQFKILYGMFCIL